MPVTINGDGSISGLSVGGLGSGVVNTATLADGAATDVKQGAGSVVQIQNVTISGDNVRTTTTTGSWLDNYSTTNQYQQIEFTPNFLIVNYYFLLLEVFDIMLIRKVMLDMHK